MSSEFDVGYNPSGCGTFHLSRTGAVNCSGSGFAIGNNSPQGTVVQSGRSALNVSSGA